VIHRGTRPRLRGTGGVWLGGAENGVTLVISLNKDAPG
jgi:hypothetical protein